MNSVILSNEKKIKIPSAHCHVFVAIPVFVFRVQIPLRDISKLLTLRPRKSVNLTTSKTAIVATLCPSGATFDRLQNWGFFFSFTLALLLSPFLSASFPVFPLFAVKRRRSESASRSKSAAPPRITLPLDGPIIIINNNTLKL